MVTALHDNGLKTDLSADPAKDSMHQPIEQIFIQAESRYLKPEELEQVKTYLQSWPERQQTYQSLRERESSIVKQTLTLLQRERPDLTSPLLEIAQQDLLLILRQSALAMLTGDEQLLQERVIVWLEDQIQLYPLQAAYESLLRILNHQLKQQLGARELELIRSFITQIQVALLV